ncbi:hypothetical protein N7510_006207 [Penicillium lagena]|uniref:uncharacterized protein n=1 Tax=Penicillium lagena TaxID=94218 RepID=UPI0025416A8E|nr:uncharacterized protein N7510_006207 [Penicillium lagena]KAJ5613013.1 hypothetical protein N7510_006207 [Penicillium lagena]
MRDFLFLVRPVEIGNRHSKKLHALMKQPFDPDSPFPDVLSIARSPPPGELLIANRIDHQEKEVWIPVTESPWVISRHTVASVDQQSDDTSIEEPDRGIRILFET